MSEADIFEGLGIEVTLNVEFSKIREVLTRIGIANRKTKTLTQSCHIFHKRNRYAIMHFKEMFLFDGKEAEYTEEDEARRNRIVKILQDWGMIQVIDDISENFNLCDTNSLNIISRQDKIKQNWKLVPKYTLGKR